MADIATLVRRHAAIMAAGGAAPAAVRVEWQPREPTARVTIIWSGMARDAAPAAPPGVTACRWRRAPDTILVVPASWPRLEDDVLTAAWRLGAIDLSRWEHDDRVTWLLKPGTPRGGTPPICPAALRGAGQQTVYRL